MKISDYNVEQQHENGRQTGELGWREGIKKRRKSVAIRKRNHRSSPTTAGEREEGSALKTYQGRK